MPYVTSTLTMTISFITKTSHIIVGDEKRMNRSCLRLVSRLNLVPYSRHVKATVTVNKFPASYLFPFRGIILRRV